MALVKTELPKSRSGRQATPLDMELVEGLIEALRKDPISNDRPAAYGPDNPFDTEGKATAQGRKYANKVAEALKTTVRVNAYSENGDKGPFHWRCYIPLSASSKNGQKQEEQKQEEDSKSKK